MHNEQEHKWEERIRFVAKHYEEGRLDTDKAWKQFASEKGIRRTIPLRRYLLAIASVALLLVGITSLYLWERSKPEWVMVSTLPDQLKDVYLPDSTLISMSGNSWIRYNVKEYGKTRREVEMKGKAFYEVTHDESRPFSVQTNYTEVEVLGTAFQVHERSASVEVHVATGKVKFTAGQDQEKKSIILTKGMSANYSMETQDIELQTKEKPNYLSWKTGIIHFHGTPLEEVIDDLTDHYNQPVRSRTSIRGERLTATFESLPLDQILMIINQTLDVRLYVEK
ncbi:transmembrane sensor [Parabacteroides sp. PF5-5]|uniref:FecR family protein n=1 Tax=unclassified Parabacteroides TaxID=2649774 RepID=UPI00247418D5|nr:MULTISPECIES: FecR domain-containing protein [unclassified Parabacteroides]MDH6304668.1 transmembrane sensor [Parabacteroides sp. PH5-39]MDH6315718.1 transmembrane sensor [Parabacteroides sp. PF5-13]MDH6319378.1 transmembrane sensor [Parabacteroides sp. PH5-13]MDH6323109.1 transmembrane sensor [Parabacteroides sp. PH5-8]MDH6326911.1 transmembrane sensor [Parabacteroides sp. PH5-41]